MRSSNLAAFAFINVNWTASPDYLVKEAGALQLIATELQLGQRAVLPNWQSGIHDVFANEALQGRPQAERLAHLLFQEKCMCSGHAQSFSKQKDCAGVLSPKGTIHSNETYKKHTAEFFGCVRPRSDDFMSCVRHMWYCAQECTCGSGSASLRDGGAGSSATQLGVGTFCRASAPADGVMERHIAPLSATVQPCKLQVRVNASFVTSDAR